MRLRSKRRRDIELPAEHARDPRLPARPDVPGALRKAGMGLKQLRELTHESRTPKRPISKR